jgi:hypothetical protein
MRNFIPKEFRFSHKFAFFIHDLLAQNIVEGEKAGIFTTEFSVDSNEIDKKIESMNQQEFWDWLSIYDKPAHFEVIYKNLLIALISDLCHFIYEGLKCSEKGKLAVSYALFRKPFKDNLLILEWLLADPEDFLEKFYDEDSEIYNPQKLSPDQKKSIIEKAIDELDSKLFTAEFIYDLRYNRSLPFSFAGPWDKANHLITSFEKIKTERQNLNFVFLSEDAIYSQWSGIYSLLPVLLHHSFGIIEKLISTISQRDTSVKDTTLDRLNAGFLLWRDSLGHQSEVKISDMKVTGDCENCKKPVRIPGKRFLTQVYKHGFAECKSCKHPIYLDDG